jgi:reactive intermediate/imine deaminase
MPRRFLAPILFLALACTAPASDASLPQAADAAPEVEYLASPEHLAGNHPYSEGVRVGHMIYLTGQIGNLPGADTVVAGGIQAETRQTLDNMKEVLERFGSSLDRVVKCTVMIEDIAEWPAMNEVYVQYFPGPKPARSAIGADGLALGASVELECWATVG